VRHLALPFSADGEPQYVAAAPFFYRRPRLFLIASFLPHTGTRRPPKFAEDHRAIPSPTGRADHLTEAKSPSPLAAFP
jgi:hypothetical protein